MPRTRPLALALALALLAVAPAPAQGYSPRDYTDCDSCVAVGYGWSPTKQRCGGFKNKACPEQGHRLVAPAELLTDAEASEPALTEPKVSIAEKLAAKRAAEAARALLAARAAEPKVSIAEKLAAAAAAARKQTPAELEHEAYLCRLAVFAAGVVALAIVIGSLIRAVCKRNGGDATGKWVKLDVKHILFTQASIEDTFRDGRTVDSMIEALVEGTLKASRVPPIRVVRKHGQYFTLDHRRLYAMRQALGGQKKALDRTVACVLESFKDEEIVKEFKRKATTENPTGIAVNSTWLADWKPFVDRTPDARRKGFTSDSDVHSDVDDVSLAKMMASPEQRPKSWGTSRGVEGHSPGSPAAKQAKAALHARFGFPPKQPQYEEESEEDSEEEEEETSSDEDDPEPAPEKAPKKFAPTFTPPTVSKPETVGVIKAPQAHVTTNYEAAFERFQKLDVDGDGKISVAELVKLGMTEEQATQEIEENDADGDGSISWGEYLAKKKKKKQHEAKHAAAAPAASAAAPVVSPRRLRSGAPAAATKSDGHGGLHLNHDKEEAANIAASHTEENLSFKAALAETEKAGVQASYEADQDEDQDEGAGVGLA